MVDRRFSAPGGLSVQTTAALVEQIPAGFESAAGVIDFRTALFSEVTYAYPSRPAARVALTGLPEPMRHELGVVAFVVACRRGAGQLVDAAGVGEGRRGAGGRSEASRRLVCVPVGG